VQQSKAFLKRVMDIDKFASLYSVTPIRNIFFVPINIYRFTLKMPADTASMPSWKCSLLLSDLK
jgi:hypothetical protein